MGLSLSLVSTILPPTRCYRIAKRSLISRRPYEFHNDVKRTRRTREKKRQRWLTTVFRHRTYSILFGLFFFPFGYYMGGPYIPMEKHHLYRPPPGQHHQTYFFSSPAAALVGEHHMAQARGWVENIDDWKRVGLKGKKRRNKKDCVSERIKGSRAQRTRRKSIERENTEQKQRC
jgi:hypothetical protein